MRETIDFGSWVAGWSALAFVVVYGAIVLINVWHTHRARQAIATRILVTGTRGKSGTVRLLHAALSGTHRSYAKISGAAAKELLPDGTEIDTPRIGTTSVCELPQSMRRAASHTVSHGIFECMAVTPELISLVQRSHVQAQIVVIPTIRLDHLEEEGLTEFEIGRSVFDAAVDSCRVLATAVDQIDLLEYYRLVCHQKDITLIEVRANDNTPQFPGHHPTNVALALAVAEYLGVARKTALAGMDAVSFEPRAKDFHVLTTGDCEMVLIDLGSANDPESAWEALSGVHTNADVLVPILVNRWERPLRAISFFASVRLHFPVVGVAGTLAGWMNSRHLHRDYRRSARHERTEFFEVTTQMARHPDKLCQAIRSHLETDHRRLVLVTLENVHDRTLEILHRTFDTHGERHLLSELSAHTPEARP